jgi:hypothetical protein
MANGSDRLLKELSTLSSNFDSLYQELKESTKANIESSEGVKNLVNDLKKGNAPETQDLEKVFKSFTESFSKTIASQNDKLISNLTENISKSLTGSASDFISKLPSQVAQVKAGQPIDFKSILGSGTIKNALSGVIPKIPGLKDGGTIEGNGIAVVGEDGPELVKLDKGNKVRTMEEQMLDMMIEEERERNIKLGRIVQQNPLQAALSKITTDSKLISEFIEYSQKDLDKSDQQELLADPDYLKDEFDYFLSERDREYFTQEDLKKLSPDYKPPKTEIIKDTEILKTPTPTPAAQEVINPVEAAPAVKNEEVKAKPKVNSSLDKLKSITALGKEKLEAAKNGMGVIGQAVNSVQELKSKMPGSPAKDADTDSGPGQSASAIERIKEIAGSLKNNSTTTSAPEVVKKSEASTTSAATPSTSTITSKDAQEIKSLLASIYQALRSPLTVASDIPFRPSGNNF